MRKNILIFGHSYASPFIDINNQYTQLFDKNEFNVTVLYLTGKPDETIRKKHLAENVIFLNPPKKSVNGLKISIIKFLLTLCKKNNYEIVICHRYKPSYVMLWVSLFYKIPFLLCVMHAVNTIKPLPRKLLIAALARKNLMLAGVSNAVRDDIQKDIWNVPKEKIITLYNAIDFDQISHQLLDKETARHQLNIPQNAFLFGHMGRLTEDKDQLTLLRAFAKIKANYPVAKLVILGDGHLESDLKSEAARLHIAQDVIFTGFVPDGFRYMKAFDTYVSSSIKESFGRAILEAMFAEVPVIATRVYGVPEVMGDTGCLVEAREPNLLAEGMTKALQASADQLYQWGLKGHQRANTLFTLDTFKKSFWEIYPYSPK